MVYVRKSFQNRILVLGCGSVAQCVIPLLIRDFSIKPSQITVLDMVDNRNRIAEELKKGVTYEQLKLTPENIWKELGKRVNKGDILLDLAWNIDSCELIDWCRKNGVRYLNSSMELWDPYTGISSKNPLDRTLYVRHMKLRKMMKSWGDNKGPSAVVEHGANPGLVSHFTKLALTQITEKLLKEGRLDNNRQASLENALIHQDFPSLAMLTGTKVIHISERDTQITHKPKEVGEFVNTWSVEGFREEGVAPAEMGWGTHEKTLPKDAFVHSDDGPCNQICLAKPAMTTRVRSWVPSGPITGMIIRHGEAFTMSDHLTVKDKSGKAIYRPTVHYSYLPCDGAINSVYELEMRDWKMHENWRILNEEIISGRDELGVLLMGHDYKSWWTGSVLSIEEARDILPGHSATTLQIAGSVVSAVQWLIDHPEEGVHVPDELPYKEVLENVTPYIGPLYSNAVNWDPLMDRSDLFTHFNQEKLDRADPWQFMNFIK